MLASFEEFDFRSWFLVKGVAPGCAPGATAAGLYVALERSDLSLLFPQILRLSYKDGLSCFEALSSSSVIF